MAIGATSDIESTDKGKIQDIAGKVKDLNGRLLDIKREQIFQRVCRDASFFFLFFLCWLDLKPAGIGNYTKGWLDGWVDD